MSFSHVGRVRIDAAFAACPHQPNPSQQRPDRATRLNRGGDPALNRAIHTIALVRMRSCARTRAYVERRTAEGKASRGIRRLIKRYITRQIYRTLTAAMTA